MNSDTIGGRWIDITGIADFEMAHSLHAPHVHALPSEPKGPEVVTCGDRIYAWQTDAPLEQSNG